MDDTLLLEKALAGVQAILGQDGLAYQGKALRFNPQQLEYAQRAAQGFCAFDNNKASLNMLQSATGLGKTLGYLVPMLLIGALSGRRVGVSTHSRYLQRQIMHKDAPLAAQWVREVTGVNLSVAVRMGRANFVSPAAVKQMRIDLQEQKTDEEVLDFLQALYEWSTATTEPDENGVSNALNSGILEDFLDAMALDAPVGGIRRENLCLQNEQEALQSVAYQDSLRACANADLTIFNHALMVFNSLSWSKDLNAAGSKPIQYMVFDEADLMPMVADSVLSHGLSLHKVLQDVESLSKITKLESLKETSALVQTAIASFQEMPVPTGACSQVLGSSQAGKSVRAVYAALKGSYDQLGKAIVVNDKQISLPGVDLDVELRNKVSTTMADLRKNVDQLHYVAQALQNTDKPDDKKIVLMSWSPVRKYPTLSVGNPNSGHVFVRLWNKQPVKDIFGDALPDRSILRGCLFTSATLGPTGKALPEAFDDFASKIGAIRFHRKKTEEVPAPESGSIHNCCTHLYAMYQPSVFGKMQFVLAGPDAPLPRLKDLPLEVGSKDAKAKKQATAPLDSDADMLDDLLEADMHQPSNPVWLAYCASMIQAAQGKGGRTLVLCLSWRDTQSIAELLTEQKVQGVIQHQKGTPLRHFIKEFKAQPNAILLSPAAWEGVDLPGTITNLVITRLPFSPPNTFEVMRKRIMLQGLKLESSKIENILRGDATTTAARKLEQGIGRGLRAYTDEVTLYVADKRFPVHASVTESLHKALLGKPAYLTYFNFFRSCIARRFLNTTYPKAQLFMHIPFAGSHFIDPVEEE